MSLAVTFDNVEAAAAALSGTVRRTGCLRAAALDAMTGGHVLFKAEQRQLGGSFKIRGALNAVRTAMATAGTGGLVAGSSGNHAVAVAIAGRLHGIAVRVVTPADAPAAKLTLAQRYGATVIPYDRYSEDRQEIVGRVAEEFDCTIIPPYDDRAVIAGQGTCALELLTDVGDLDALLVPVSGGGLLAGTAVAARALAPNMEVIGVEPQLGDDHRRSLTAGRPVPIPVPVTIADALTVTRPGQLTFAINQRLVDDVVTVSDDEIRQSMRLLYEQLHAVVEPSGAVGLAALLSGRIRTAGRRVGIILSGGNIDVLRFEELTNVRIQAGAEQ